MPDKPNILVLYGYLEYPMRSSVRDLVYSFKEYSNANCFYYTPDQGEFPQYLKKVKFDLIIFTTILISERWRGREEFKRLVTDKIGFLKNYDAIKVVHPQDEWIQTNLLNDFINEFNVNHIFTVAPESEWKVIYNRVDRSKVKFHEVLTGYLDKNTLSKLEKATSEVADRDIDVGYRAFNAPAWLGSHGFLKTTIAKVFQEKAPQAGFKIDISTNEKDTILGDNWFKFLARCKYFIGVEGGSTVLDPDGEIWEKGTAYQKTHPNASFEEFEKNCFPGMDGNLKLIAISPRHLECCATKTCQVLIEGDYNGILKADKHYIPLKKDFSNLEEVFQKMRNDSLRLQIINTAYKDIVASQKYSYKAYVDFVLLSSNIPNKKRNFSEVISGKMARSKNESIERKYWGRQRSHKFPNELTWRNIWIKFYNKTGLRKVKQVMTGK